MSKDEDLKTTVENVDFIETTSMTVRGSRRRTTVPKKIFDRLALADKDQLRWIMFKNGKLLVEKVHPERKKGETDYS